MDKIIIQACLNGSRSRDQNPNVPWMPSEVAEEAIRCFNAGASIVHFHARTPEGGVSYDCGWYTQTDELIRSRCDIVLNHTTARREQAPVGSVLEYLQNTPVPVEMVSVNFGYDIQWLMGSQETLVTPNSFSDILAILDTCSSRGIFPETAVHDSGMLNLAVTMVQRQEIPPPSYFLVEFEANWGDGRQAMPGTTRNYFALTGSIQELFPKAMLMVHGVGTDAHRIASIGVSTGAHIRVGFEDSLCLPGNDMPSSNAEFVEWGVVLSRGNGREPCSPEEARQMLHLLPYSGKEPD